MKALLSHAPGPPASLAWEEVPAPTCGPGEALIEVRGCGLNFSDVLMLDDRYQLKPPRPFAPGGEIGGVVIGHGEGVSEPPLGAAVAAYIGHGGLAERVAVRASALIPLPRGLAITTAAGMPITYGAAWYALTRRAALRPGERLLVLGAASGAGLAAVELGRALGANVVAAASSAERVALAQAQGAQEGLVTPETLGPDDREAQRAFAATLKAAARGDGFDVIYDAIGGGYCEPALRAMAWEGRYLVVGFAAGIPRPPLNLALLKGCQILGVFWTAFVEREPQAHAAGMAELFALAATGALRPVVTLAPRSEAQARLAAIAARQSSGKIVIELT